VSVSSLADKNDRCHGLLGTTGVKIDSFLNVYIFQFCSAVQFILDHKTFINQMLSVSLTYSTQKVEVEAIIK